MKPDKIERESGKKRHQKLITVTRDGEPINEPLLLITSFGGRSEVGGWVESEFAERNSRVPFVISFFSLIPTL